MYLYRNDHTDPVSASTTFPSEIIDTKIVKVSVHAVDLPMKSWVSSCCEKMMTHHVALMEGENGNAFTFEKNKGSHAPGSPSSATVTVLSRG